MKFKLRFIIGIAVLGLAMVSTPARAQVNQLPPTSTFFQSVQGYFSSFDTNSTTFSSETAELWTGMDSSPDNLSAVAGLTVKLSDRFAAEVVIRNASVAGTVESAQIGPAYTIIHYDTKLSAGLDGGYKFTDEKGFIEAYVDVRKALTENTFAGLRLYYDQAFSGGTKAHAPGIVAITGFKF